MATKTDEPTTAQLEAETKELLASSDKLEASARDKWKAAAKNIGILLKRGRTQKQIAEAVGASTGKISALVNWGSANYPAGSPYGPTTKPAREAAMRTKGDSVQHAETGKGNRKETQPKLVETGKGTPVDASKPIAAPSIAPDSKTPRAQRTDPRPGNGGDGAFDRAGIKKAGEEMIARLKGWLSLPEPSRAATLEVIADIARLANPNETAESEQRPIHH